MPKVQEIIIANPDPSAADPWLGTGSYKFRCVGCGDWHVIPTRGEKPWGFNGNVDRPTFTPSLMVYSGHYYPFYKTATCWCTYRKDHPDLKNLPSCYRCHSTITDGRQMFYLDSTHGLAGQTVEMRELENEHIKKQTSMSKITPDQADRVLGRIFSPDARDKNYSVSRLLSAVPIPKAKRRQSWGDRIWSGDQGYSPKCVGFAWAHNLEDEPTVHSTNRHPYVSPDLIYAQAQLRDGYPLPHDGTTVRAGAQYLQACGLIGAYHWATTLDELVKAVLYLGSVVVGTNWYTDMFFPDMSNGGVIKIGGQIEGGHCYDINAVDLYYKGFRIKNSWGKEWGILGHAFISFDDMERLIHENGEVCIATRLKI